LQFDPAIDLLLNRLTCCFLPTAAGRGEEEFADRLRKMARALGPDDVLLLFPRAATGPRLAVGERSGICER
jgi:hypothetical protein